MFRRFIAMTFALMFMVVSGSAVGQGIQFPEVVFLFCQGNPETGDTEVCDMESSDPNANPITNGTRCVDALALLFALGYESFPALAIVEGGPDPAGLGESTRACPRAFNELAEKHQHGFSPIIVFPLSFKIDVGDPLPPP